MAYLIPEEDWYEVKREIKDVLIDVATSDRRFVTYGELTKMINKVQIQPNSPDLFKVLGEISEDEVCQGRGMLSALVINESEHKPGKGFFSLAKDLGKDVTDKDKLWIEELNFVCEYWRDAK